MTTKTKKDGTPAKSAGRPQGAKGTTSLKSRKFKDLGFDLKVHVAEAIATAAKLMGTEETPATVKMQAAKFIIDKYGECIKEAYGNDPKKNGNNEVEDDDEDEKPQAAVLSFVVPTKK